MSYKEYSIQQLRSIVIHGLDNDLIPSAEFAAERLVAETTNEDMDSLHLYGLVLLKKNRLKTAYNTTANKLHPGCSYVFAKAALQLELGSEGIASLLSTQHLWESSPNTLHSNYEHDRKLIPDPATFYSLLGRLYSLVGDFKESAVNHSKALKKNPFIWESFEELNKMGANVRVKSIYKVATNSTTSKFSLGSGSGNDALANITVMNDFYSRDPFGDTSNLNPPKSASKNEFFDFGKATREESPEFQTPRVKQTTLPNAPTRKTRSSVAREAFKQPPSLPTSNNHNTNGNGGAGGNNNSTGSESIKRPTRLSTSKVTSRLMAHPLSSATKNSTNLSASSNSRKNSVNEHTLRKNKIFAISSSNDTQNGGSGGSSNLKRNLYMSNEEYGEQYLLNLYLSYAKGFKAMAKYDSFKAIRLLTALPKNHLNTPWTLSKLGRLHFEIVNYEESLKFFTKLRELDPTRIEDMEYFSTLLWHMHEEVALCHLAHELQNVDKNAPQTWVTIGNLFSLTREHDEAIKCFQRTTQIDSKFAYAYTLQGHEYLTNDAYENALESFRLALILDPRHYNALYGIGMVYLKLGNFNRAEFHFRKAVDINPVNVILLCCVGMMLEKLGKRQLALNQYELACKIQPLSALPLFKKAQLLYSMEQFNAALVEFEYLETIAPDEASVHFLLGQLYRLSDRKLDAVKQFTIALNLDPKGGHLVKAALEGLQD